MSIKNSVKNSIHLDLPKNILETEMSEIVKEKKMEDLTEEEIAVIKKKIDEEFKIALREASRLLSDDQVYLIRKQGFFANILVDTKKVITTSVPIAAINIINTMQHLYINPLTFPQMPKPNRIAVLIHEVLHLALGHVFRYLDLPDDEQHHYIWNLSTDCAINQLIPKTSDIFLPEGCIMPSSFKEHGIEMPLMASSEEYNKILHENKDNLPQNMKSGMGEEGDKCPECGGSGEEQGSNDSNEIGEGDSQDSGSSNEESEGEGNQKACSCCGGSGKDPNGQGGEGNSKKPENWHKKWGETQGNRKMNEAAVKKSVKDAYSKSIGDVPGNLKPIIEKIIESKIDWRSKLRVYTAKHIKSGVLTTYSRESRRLGDLVKGRRKKQKLSILVAVDTSASVRDEDLAKFSGEIKSLHRTGAKITVCECDVNIHDVYEFKGKINRLEYKGRGGTTFLPPFEMVEKQRMKIDLVMYLTDGYGQAPDKFNIPTIWVLTPDGVKPHDSSGQKVTWGNVVQIS